MTPSGLPADGASTPGVGHLSMPKVGERANGDRVVLLRRAAQTLLGVVDALGHGHGAEEVSVAALEYLAGTSASAPLHDIITGLHEHLRGTRGAAATLCSVVGDRLEACGVGNVELRCAETPIPFVFSPGILGVRVTRFRVCQARLAPRTRVVFFSDGISSRLRIEDVRALAPQDACRRIFERNRRPEDDATVLIADLG